MSLSALFALRPSTTEDKLIPLLLFHSSSSFTSQKTTMTSPQRPTLLPPNDTLLTLSRQEAHLQSTLQHLLDAQSEGILAGLNGASSTNGDGESGGTRTPTTTSVMESTIRSHHHDLRSVTPVRQPTKRKLGLQGARRGIARTIADLAALKSEEGKVLESEVFARSDVLSTVHNFERKSTGLREQIRGIGNEESSRRIEHLKQEERNLGNEIHALETKLYEMKAQQRHLTREIDGLSNSVQSKLSSYESALALAEKDIRKFLDKSPLDMPAGAAGAAKRGIWALPKERRTLEMASDFYTEEQQALKIQLEGVQAEAEALEEGGMAWEEVVQEVNGVEKALRQEMQRMHALPLLEGGQEGNAETGMKGILQTMQEARARIEAKLDHAERNNWKLLVCCIGAELEALVEGQAVLEDALRAAQDGTKDLDRRNDRESSYTNGTQAAEAPPIDDASTLSSRDAPPPALDFLDRSEDEDDGPGPELLISHHEE